MKAKPLEVVSARSRVEKDPVPLSQRLISFWATGDVGLARPLSLSDLCVLFLFAFLAGTRLLRLSSVPAIYPDESNYLEFGHNLLCGRFEWGVFTHTFLPRLPLPLLMDGLSQQIFGPTLFAVRLVSAAVGVATGIMLFLLVCWHARGETLCLWVLLVYTIFPFIMIYNRWGLTYNWLPMLSMAALFSGLSMTNSGVNRASRWVLILSAAIALVCEPLGLGVAAYAVVILIIDSPRRIISPLICIFSPLFLYFVWLWIKDDALLLSDIRISLFARIMGNGDSNQPAIAECIQGLQSAHGWYLWGGLIGIWLLPDRLRRHAFLQVIIWFILLITTAASDYTLLVRESIVFFPYVALGWGCLLDRSIARFRETLAWEFAWIYQLCNQRFHLKLRPLSSGIKSVLPQCAVAMPTLLLIYGLLVLPPRILLNPACAPTALDPICVSQTDALEKATQYLIAHVSAQDVVLGDHLTRLLPCHKSSLMQMAVVSGAHGNPFFPLEVFAQRRRYAWHLEDSRFVLLTPYNFNIEKSFPGVAELLNRTAAWPVVFEQDGIIIRKNPAIASAS